MSASRRMRRRQKKHTRIQKAEWDDFVKSLGDIGNQPLGITFEQAMSMVWDGAHKMAARMSNDGGATRAPWGPVVYDCRALEKTLQTSVLMMHRGIEGIDQRGDAPDLTNDESMQFLLSAIGGALSAASAAVLWLMSQPIPYDLARHVTATENPAK